MRLGAKGRLAALLGLGELLKQRLGRIKLKGQSRLVHCYRGSFLSHLLALQVALERVEKEAIMGHAVPVEHLLLLLRADTVVLVEEV